MTDRTILGLVALALVATNAYVVYRLLEAGDHQIDVTLSGDPASDLVPLSLN